MADAGETEAVETTEAAQARLFTFLDDLGIEHVTHRHDPVFTVAEAQTVRDRIAGGHTKNLFLKDKKDNYFLVALEEEAEVDLKSIHTLIRARGRVSFGKPDKLMDFLGVRPGSVTLLAAINDAGKRVTVVIDEGLMGFDVINMHPLSNDATTALARDDVLKYLAATGHEPLVLKLAA